MSFLFSLRFLLMTFPLSLWFELAHTSMPRFDFTDVLKPSVVSLSHVLCSSSAHVHRSLMVTVGKGMLTYVNSFSTVSSHEAKELILCLFIIIAHDRLPKMHIEISECTYFELLICTALIFPNNHNNSCCFFSS